MLAKGKNNYLKFPDVTLHISEHILINFLTWLVPSRYCSFVWSVLLLLWSLTGFRPSANFC